VAVHSTSKLQNNARASYPGSFVCLQLIIVQPRGNLHEMPIMHAHILQDAGELQSFKVGIPLRYTCTCNQLITYVILIRTQYKVHLLNLAGAVSLKQKKVIDMIRN
jgi:hypothetical protein